MCHPNWVARLIRLAGRLPVSWTVEVERSAVLGATAQTAAMRETLRLLIVTLFAHRDDVLLI